MVRPACRELAELERLLGPGRGPGGVALFGDAGVGKTRLVAEVVDGRRAEGMAVEWVRATEAAKNIPLGIIANGLELFDLQLTRESQGWVVRVTIDRPGPAATPEDSVGIEDCATVSRELSTILDVDDPLDRAYTLEVTSPGLDRPLRHEADFRRFAGRTASIVLEAPRSTIERLSE